MRDEQCLAARAMLRWTKEDLAQAAGVSLAPIHNLEKGKSVQEASLLALRSAFEEAGIEFISGGVKRRQDKIRLIEGEGAYAAVLDGFISEQAQAGELLIFCAKNNVSPPEVTQKELILRQRGIKFRFLVEEGDEFLTYPLQEYRYIPQEHFFNSPIMIFGNYVVLSPQQTGSVKLMEFPDMAKALTGIFNALWDQGKMPTNTIAAERYV